MKDKEIHDDNNVWSQLKDRKIYKDLMLMLGLNEIIYLLAMVSSIPWYGLVLRKEDIRL